MARRGVSPVIGVVLLVAITVTASAAVGAATFAIDRPESGPTAVIDASAHADGRIQFVHRGGDALVVSTLELRVTVGGTPLRYQPPVPFVGARGFRGAPSGPFNGAGDGTWSAGERASVTLAGTNAPALTVGTVVDIRITADERPVARVRTRVSS